MMAEAVSNYLENLLKLEEMFDCNSCDTPLDVNIKDAKPLKMEENYKCLLRSCKSSLELSCDYCTLFLLISSAFSGSVEQLRWP